MVLNDMGNIVHNAWMQTPVVRPNVSIDEFVVMPNHFHGIIVINSAPCRGVSPYAPTGGNQTHFKSPSQTIGAIVRGFKSMATKQINVLNSTPGKPVWQRNYYDHIIRDNDSLYKIRQYIKNNPGKWEDDDFYDYSNRIIHRNPLYRAP